MSKSTQLTTGQDRSQLISVLQSSLYAGAKAESVGLVIDYCHAAQLDPMQKPVHIVPMNTKDPISGEYVWRDVIMPGVGLYRIQADRSKTMAGISEPEFGPDIQGEFTDKNGNKVSTIYPEWCRITVKKVVGDHVVEFVAKEYWLENYATDSGRSNAPNTMWRKRPRGQLAKCAEAQALRKGWPEIGQAPTAEEMEGKTIDVEVERVSEPEAPKTPPAYPDDRFETNLPKWRKSITDGKKTADAVIATVSSAYTLSQEQKARIRGADEFVAQYEETAAEEQAE